MGKNSSLEEISLLRLETGFISRQLQKIVENELSEGVADAELTSGQFTESLIFQNLIVRRDEKFSIHGSRACDQNI